MPKITIIIPLGENKETDFIEYFDKQQQQCLQPQLFEGFGLHSPK